MEYNAKLEEVDEITRKATVNVAAQEVQKAYDHELSGLMKGVAVKGFRPGKAPKEIVRKQYGKRIEGEVTRKMISESLFEFVRKEDLELVGEPDIDIDAWKEGEDLVYHATIQLYPRPKIGGYDKIEVEVVEKTVGDEDVDGAIKKLQQERATSAKVEDRENVQENDVVKGTLLMHVEGEEEPRPEPLLVALDEAQLPEELKTLILLMKVGEEKELETTLPDDLQDEARQGKPVRYVVKIDELMEKRLPELNDDFAKQTPYEVETVLELRLKIREELEARLEEEKKADVHAAILEAVLEKNDFKVPQALIDNEIRNMLARFGFLDPQKTDINRVDVTPFREHFSEMAEKRVKTSVVGAQIAVQENLEASDEALEEAMKKLADSANIELEEVQKYFAGEEQKAQLRQEETGNKVIEFLEERAKVTYVEKKEDEEKASVAE